MTRPAEPSQAIKTAISHRLRGSGGTTNLVDTDHIAAAFGGALAPASRAVQGGINLAAMSDSSTESTQYPGALPGPGSRPTLFAIFLAFAGASVAAFGGALPWVRRAVVEQRHWMTPQEFNEAFSLAQFLPGPNALNFSIVFGLRVHGLAGSVVAFSGLLGPPLVIVIMLAVLYDRFGDIPVLNQVLSGVAAAAAGLMIAFCAKMIQPLFKQRDWTVVVALVGFVCVAVIQWPLPIVFVVLAPISVVLAWFRI